MATAAEHRAEIDRINANIAAAFTKAQAKGATLPATQNSGTLEDAIDAIPSQNELTKRDSDDLTVSGATVSAPAGYYEQAASKSVATATQATPTITVDANGLITASATQSAGYVSKGTKSATKQLTVETWTLELENGSTTEKVVVL